MINMENQEKIFLQPGDVVTLKQDIPNKPTMVVIGKEFNILDRNGILGNFTLKGLRCRWFTTDGFLQEMVVSTKDLILIQGVNELQKEKL